VGIAPTVATEFTYVVRGEVSPEALTNSLQALLPTRLHTIGRHRFTILDTFDGRVRRAGTRLTRAGVNGTSTIAWRSRGGNELTVQSNQPVSFAWDLPDGPLQQELAPIIGVRRLLAQADAEQHGSRLDVLDERGKTVARIRIESGRARLPRSRHGWQPLPTVIILTALRGYEDIYAELTPLVESRPGVEPCAEGLHGLMLRLLGAVDHGDLSSPRLALVPTVSAAAGARQIHLALLGLLVTNEPGLRANFDTEFLHDFRVTVRRTRSLLGQIKDVFPADAVAHFSTEFSWIGQLTSAPRDTDVLVLSLRAHARDVSAGDMEALSALLRDEQQQHHQGLVDALNSDRYVRLLSEWRAFLEDTASPDPEPQNAGRLLAEVVAERAWRLSRRIATSADAIDGQTDADRLHAIRIDAKKLRYLVDVTPGFFNPADLQLVVGALKKLQRVLGDFHDSQVQEARLLECARTLSAPNGSRAAVESLADAYRQRGEHLRAQVTVALKRFRAHDTKSACRRAFKDAYAGELAP